MARVRATVMTISRFCPGVGPYRGKSPEPAGRILG